jgi:hypothetical protein
VPNKDDGNADAEAVWCEFNSLFAFSAFKVEFNTTVGAAALPNAWALEEASASMATCSVDI